LQQFKGFLKARVSIEGKIFSEIGPGLVIFVCFEKDDSMESIASMVGQDH
jgi:D-Tyr-tRNAtyr deacylase